MNASNAWGSDVPVSMPEPVDQGDVLLDFGSHVFTANGMRINMSRAVRAEITANAYEPIDKGDPA